MDLAARTAELFDHFSTQEFDGLADLFAPGAQVRQNGNPEHGIDGLFMMIEGLKRDGVTVEYSDVRRSVGDRFVVEQHIVRLTRPDGVSASTDVCVVVHFDDAGQITGMHEYVDTAAFGSLLG
jgi:ketosteroid isomerase-like protein